MPHKEKEFIIADYMHTEVVTISQTSTLEEALQSMIRSETNGLVVVDHARHVVGIVSISDLIKRIVPDYLEEDKHLASFEAGEVFVTRTMDMRDVPVSEFMTSPVHTVRRSHTIMEAAALLSEYHIGELPVVDEKDVLVGYVSRSNIKHAMGDVFLTRS